MLMKQDTKRQLLKVDKEASAAREKAYQDYVMQYEMAVAKQQSEAWRKAIDGVPDSLRMLLEINNTENVTAMGKTKILLGFNIFFFLTD